jgi:predicted GTPase
MPANKMNFIVLYEGHSQIYGAGSEEIALASPPPKSCEIEQKHVFFITHEPDSDNLAVYEIARDKVLEAEIIHPKTSKKGKEQQQNESSSKE